MANTLDGTVIGSGLRYNAQARIVSDKFILYIFFFIIISLLSQSALLLINWGQLPPVVPIFYSKPWGDMMLAAPIFLWILPGITLIFFIINYFLAIYILREYYFLNRVLIVFTAFIAFSTLYNLSRIIGLLV